jgi:uncharacterized membrane protein
MDRMLVVVFNGIGEAFEGRNALKDLDRDDSITDYASAIITRNADGTIVVNDEKDEGVLRSLLGTSLGNLIGLLGGPAGLAIGTIAGSLAGATADLDNACIGADFVDEVSKALTPGKYALVAEIDEEWTPWVNLRMEELGGSCLPPGSFRGEARGQRGRDRCHEGRSCPDEGLSMTRQARQPTKPSCSKTSINSIQRYSSSCRRRRNGMKSPRLRLRQKSRC